MHKQQQAIQQKIEGFISSLPSKDRNTIKRKLKELELIEHPHRFFEISKLREAIDDQVSPQTLQKYKELRQKLKLKKNVLQIMQKGKLIWSKLDEYLSLSEEQLQKRHSLLMDILDCLNSFQQLSSLAFPDFGLLREQLYLQLLAQIGKHEQQFANIYGLFKRSLESLALPLKKNEIRKEKPDKRQRLNILNLMHQQNCLITLKRQIKSLLQRQDCQEEKLLECYWEPSLKTVKYLFTNGSELHNLEEPGWMFQYLHLLLNSNYKYFCDYLLEPDIRPDISKALNNYFLEGSVDYLFMKAIEARLEKDLEKDKQKMNPFLWFNFCDEVSGLQVKLHSIFGLRADLLQKILLKYDGVLEKVFEYQNERFQTKIFEDFININYSKINLKNLQAYNLMIAFLNMLESLQSKYRLINDPALKTKIFKFYRERIMVLVAHLKTSFDRIYNHSRFPKLDILVSFKRTENQLRENLSEITASDPQLDENLQKQYYCFLEQYYEAAALQAVTPVHKKLHISLADILNKFASLDDSNHEMILNGFSKIQQQWITKMDQISKFSNYIDSKLRNIFFTYLEASTFSSVGLNLFLKIFQPFLQAIFVQEKHRTLISMITIQQERYLEYLEAHPSALAFLSQQQAKKLHKFKLSHPEL